MASRPVWEGHLRLSLVTCPVALYGATTRANDVSFHLINPETGNRIRMVPHDPESGEVERSDLVRGFEITKGRYVTLTNDEIKAVRLPSTRSIDIEEFVDEGEIDRIYWNDPYYLVPSGAAGVEAFTVIREAMARQKRVALGRVVMHTRERLVAIEPRDKGLLVTTLRTHEEVRDAKEIFSAVPDAQADKRMLEIAGKIIEQQEARFDPARFEDRYESALRALIEEKARTGDPIVASAPEAEETVIDLMDALARSLKQGGGQTQARAKRFLKSAKPASRPAAARTTGGGKRRAAG
jgi:DNA end-binding protein Ku